MSYRDELSRLVQSLKARGEQELIPDIESFIMACGEYVYQVNNLEAAITVGVHYKELKEYSEYKNKLDAERHNIHNSLIVSLKLVTRYCTLAEMEPIYKGNLDNRIQIGDFALEVAAEFFETRIL